MGPSKLLHSAELSPCLRNDKGDIAYLNVIMIRCVCDMVIKATEVAMRFSPCVPIALNAPMLILVVLATVGFTGCATLGPKSSDAHSQGNRTLDANQAVIKAWETVGKEQDVSNFKITVKDYFEQRGTTTGWCWLILFHRREPSPVGSSIMVEVFKETGKVFVFPQM
jgi:hypothetical protein